MLDQRRRFIDCVKNKPGNLKRPVRANKLPGTGSPCGRVKELGCLPHDAKAVLHEST